MLKVFQGYTLECLKSLNYSRTVQMGKSGTCREKCVCVIFSRKKTRKKTRKTTAMRDGRSVDVPKFRLK